MRVGLDADKKTMIVPWNYAAKLDDTDKHLKVADRPARKVK